MEHDDAYLGIAVELNGARRERKADDQKVRLMRIFDQLRRNGNKIVYFLIKYPVLLHSSVFNT